MKKIKAAFITIIVVLLVSINNYTPCFAEEVTDTISPIVLASIKGGKYNSNQQVTLTISENGKIYYTTDGSEPTINSKVYTEAIDVVDDLILRYIAVDEVGNLSKGYTQNYILDKINPVVSNDLEEGVYYSNKQITLNANEESEIFYTVDGADPLEKGLKYKDYILIEQDTVIKYAAIDVAGNKSEVYTKKYSIKNMDLDNDKNIDSEDIDEIAEVFNDEIPESEINTKEDLNNDNIIDIYDLVLLSKQINVATKATVEIDKPSSIEMNKSFVLTAAGVGTNTVLYQYRIKNDINKEWTVLKDFSGENTYTWIPSEEGNFKIEVRIKDSSSTKEFDDTAYIDVYVHSPSITYVESEHTLEEMTDMEYGNSAKPQYWENGGFVDATKEQVEYYLNPDNFKDDEKGKFMFMKLSYMAGIDIGDLNNMLVGKGVLAGKGKVFLEAGKAHGINPVYLISHALLETGNGTSALCNGSLSYNGFTIYNVYGVGAYDSNPNYGGSEYAYNKEWFSIDDAIIGGAEFISRSYIQSNKYNSNYQDTLYKMRWNDETMWHQYATDVRWAYNQVSRIKKLIDLCTDSFLYFEIPIYESILGN